MENNSEIKPTDNQNLGNLETTTEQTMSPVSVEGGSPVVTNGENSPQPDGVSPKPEIAKSSEELNSEMPTSSSSSSEASKTETETAKDVKPKKKKKAKKPKIKKLRTPKRIVVGKDKLTEEDFEYLRDCIRMSRLKVIPEKPRKKINWLKRPKIEPTMNRAFELRRQASKDRINHRLTCPNDEDIEKMKKILKRVEGEEKKKIKQTHTTKLRWMKIRNMPVFSEYFKQNFYQYGKPPYAIPMKYVPFNMLWEADWVKNPYEWEDEQ